jgi:hypothetical protein
MTSADSGPHTVPDPEAEAEATTQYQTEVEHAQTPEELDTLQKREQERRDEEHYRAASEPRDEGGQFISRAELEKILAERDQAHRQELAAVRATVPAAMVPMHGGGPGVDKHQRSWSLAEQEIAARGDVLDHWEGLDDE